ncbi:hypothetical protein GCM10023149_16120 [Mucilaginibacter gynuensis]|uniref:Uncharacterized protein n=2 Tax=Mucilaginibacter gynuensis TaxID=1302236 RepID=A0ABP8G5X8_9SPHI
MSSIRKKQPSVKVSKIRFNAEITSKLISRSKTEGTTVTGILYAAIAFAMKGTDDRFINGKIGTRVPVSVRNELKSGKNVVLNVITKTMMLDIFSDSNIWDLARQVSIELGALNTVGQISGYVSYFRKEMLRHAKFSEIVTKMKATIGTDLMLSNLGNLTDQSYGDFKILELWGPLVISGTGTEQTIGAVTIGGELTLTQVSSAPIPALLEETMELLLANL